MHMFLIYSLHCQDQGHDQAQSGMRRARDTDSAPRRYEQGPEAHHQQPPRHRESNRQDSSRRRDLTSATSTAGVGTPS
jgi:hypothetical protein